MLFTQALNEEWLVSVGKFNLLDLFRQVCPQLSYRGRPLSGRTSALAGFGITKLQGMQVQGPLAVLDTHNSSTTTGLSWLDDSGAVIVGCYGVFTGLFERPGSHAVLGLYSNGTCAPS